MGIQRLDHVNLRTGQLSAMLQWYGDVLGLHSGPRPDFPFAGAWLYAGDVAVIHLIDIGCLPAISSDASLRLEHFSLAATDIEAFEERLAASRTHYQRIALAGSCNCTCEIRTAIICISILPPHPAAPWPDLALGGHIWRQVAARLEESV